MLDYLNKLRTRNRVNRNPGVNGPNSRRISSAVDSADRPNNADAPVPSRLDGSPGPGLDHTEYGNIIPGLRLDQTGGSAGVAGNDDQLDAPLHQ